MRRLHPERFQMPKGGMSVPQAPLEAMGHSRTLEDTRDLSAPLTAISPVSETTRRIAPWCAFVAGRNGRMST